MTSIALVRDVGQECHLARPLDRERDLALVPAARAGDPARSDLPLLGDVPPQLVHVLVVDLFDLLAAVPAVLLTDRPGGGAAPPSLLPVFRLRHQRSPPGWLVL